MFLIDKPDLHYRDPWVQSHESRRARLLMNGSRQRVAYVYETPDNSTFRYRVYNMIQALEQEPGIAAAWFELAEIQSLIEDINQCDSLVLCRVRYSDTVSELLARARAAGVVTIFDCDDFVFDSDYVQLVTETLDQPVEPAAWDVWFAYFARLGATLRLCDRVVVTNGFIAERVRAFAPEKDVRIIGNFLDREQIALSGRLRDEKRAGNWRRGGPVHIGYFSGTPTHQRDFAVVAEPLATLLRRHQNLQLRIVGYLELPGNLVEFSERIEQLPLTNFLHLQALIAEVEINIAPLQNNVFTNCKSELKYFEAAIAGTITAASPTHAFAAAIVDGDNGILCPSHTWTDRLEAALDSLREDDGFLYPEMAERAAAHAASAYAPEAMCRDIELALFERKASLNVIPLALSAAG